MSSAPNPTVNEILRDARAMLRDLLYDRPISELHRSLDEVIAEITFILDDGYNPDTGDTNDDQAPAPPQPQHRR